MITQIAEPPAKYKTEDELPNVDKRSAEANAAKQKAYILCALREEAMRSIGFRLYCKWDNFNTRLYALERHVKPYRITGRHAVMQSPVKGCDVCFKSDDSGRQYLFLIPRNAQIHYEIMSFSEENLFSKKIKLLLNDEIDDRVAAIDKRVIRKSNFAPKSPTIGLYPPKHVDKYLDAEEARELYESRKKALLAIGFKKYDDAVLENSPYNSVYALEQHVHLYDYTYSKSDCAYIKSEDGKLDYFSMLNNAQISYNLMAYANDVIFGEKIRQLFCNII